MVISIINIIISITSGGQERSGKTVASSSRRSFRRSARSSKSETTVVAAAVSARCLISYDITLCYTHISLNYIILACIILHDIIIVCTY